jgi:hypothetical protein
MNECCQLCHVIWTVTSKINGYEQAWWYMSIIPAIWEAESRIVV